MPDVNILLITLFLFAGLLFYLWSSLRNLYKNKTLTYHDYLWKLKCITGKSEYELFRIAAEEKGWPGYQVDMHFKRYLKDQTLPDYVKAFLEDGREHISAYRPKGGGFFNRKIIAFYSMFSLLLIGGSFVLCLYVFPWIFPFYVFANKFLPKAIRVNPKLAPPFIARAIDYSLKGQIEKACADLELACDLGYCDEYEAKRREGICR
jgi:hypothetical protein